VKPLLQSIAKSDKLPWSVPRTALRLHLQKSDELSIEHFSSPFVGLADRANEHRFLGLAIQFWFAAKQHGADLQLPRGQ
jgi:hypothetical protein